MADVMQQSRGQKNPDIFVLQDQRRIRLEKADEKLLGEVIDPERVLEAGVPGARVDQMNEPQLADIAKTLKLSGVYQCEQGVWQVDITPDWIPDRFAFFLQQGVVHGGQTIRAMLPCQALLEVIDSTPKTDYFNALTASRRSI